MNVLKTIQKSIEIVDKLKEDKVATYETYKSEMTGKCCLVGNIAEELGCEVDPNWALGEDKPCLNEKFGDRDLVEIIDENLSMLHEQYCNNLHYEKAVMARDNGNFGSDYWDGAPKLTFKEMKREAKKFLKSLLPKGGK